MKITCGNCGWTGDSESWPWPLAEEASPAERYRYAVKLLRQARDLLNGAPRAQERVRKALSSADGAVRHAETQEAAEARHG